MKYLIGWIFCGLLILILAINTPEKRSMTRLQAITFVAIGPILLPVIILVYISDLDKCIFNCKK